MDAQEARSLCRRGISIANRITSVIELTSSSVKPRGAFALNLYSNHNRGNCLVLTRCLGAVIQELAWEPAKNERYAKPILHDRKLWMFLVYHNLWKEVVASIESIHKTPKGPDVDTSSARPPAYFWFDGLDHLGSSKLEAPWDWEVSGNGGRYRHGNVFLRIRRDAWFVRGRWNDDMDGDVMLTERVMASSG